MDYQNKSKTIQKCFDSTGKKRVLILQREDGLYTFLEEHFSDDPFEMCWIPRTKNRSLPICQTREIALAEAIGRIDWFSDMHQDDVSNDA